MDTVTKAAPAQTRRPFSSETNFPDAQKDVRARLAGIPPTHRLRILAALMTEASLACERATEPKRADVSPAEAMKIVVPVTARQGAILNFIASYIETNSIPPTIREIGESFGIRSTNGVMDHLKALARKGLLQLMPKRSRGIRLTLPTRGAS